MIRKFTSGRSGRFAVLAALIAVGAIAAPLYAFGGGDKTTKNAEATLLTSAGVEVGTVELKQEKDGLVKVKAKFDVLPAGFHGFHVHTTGTCTGPTFTSAGGHFNLTTATHGGHSGDMPVLLVKADGTAEQSFETDRFTVDQLFDADGSAIIVHALADNYANIPTANLTVTPATGYTPASTGPMPSATATTAATGDAGTRFACGVVVTGNKGHNNDNDNNKDNDDDD